MSNSIINNSTMSNGRIVNINQAFNSIPMYQENDNNNNYKDKAVSNIQQKTILSEMYFSEENINNLQNIIRYRIYNLTIYNIVKIVQQILKNKFKN